jgi:hypothetical protein
VKQQKRAILAAGSEKIFYNGYSIENVSWFKYLGAKLMSHGSDEEEVFDRVEKAQGAFRSRGAIWRNRRVPLNLKIRLYNVFVNSTLLYGCESWTITKQILSKIRGFTARCFARMINVPFIEMSSALSRINVIDMIEKRRWKWLGHVIRMNSLRNPHQCLTILDDFRPGNLLAHLPLNIRSVASRSLAAKNTDWMTKTYFERISLNTQCP